MPRNFNYDILGGAALILLGSFFGIYALATLRIGTVASMGPGMFPMAAGFILAIFGAVILLISLFKSQAIPSFDLRSFLLILGGILAFAATIRPFGAVPAIMVLTLISSRADDRLSLLSATVLGAGLSLVAVLVFKYGLGMPFDVVAWPW